MTAGNKPACSLTTPPYRRRWPTLKPSTSPAALPAGEITVPDSPAAIIASVRGDAATAQVQFTDAISAASRYRAALYASIAACLASHRAVLA